MNPSVSSVDKRESDREGESQRVRKDYFKINKMCKFKILLFLSNNFRERN